jgi:hypothetical protein
MISREWRGNRLSILLTEKANLILEKEMSMFTRSTKT